MLKLLKEKTTYETILSYLLGLCMLPYALTKLLRTQFVVMPFYQWSEPLKDISGVTLTWAFLGYSKWFTILLGVLELLPAILLLFRKTRLLGAILLLPVVLNVFLINIALDLWEDTQLISGLLLILNLLVLSLNFPVLKDFFVKTISASYVKTLKIKIELAVNILLLGVVSYLFLEEVTPYLAQRTFLTGDWYDDRPSVWLVKETVRADSVIRQDSPYEGEYTRYYFHPQNFVSEFLPGESQPKNKAYRVDEEKKRLKIFIWQKSDTIKGDYRLTNDTTMVWMLDDGNEMTLIRRTLR